MKRKKSDLYTKTGDRGTTSLVGGQRVKKSALKLDAYGTIDELNAFIGWLLATNLPQYHREVLIAIQNRLFLVGANLATHPEDVELKQKFQLPAEDLAAVELALDTIDAENSPMTCFILPSGGEIATRAHICRTVSRRAERILCELNEEEKIDPTIMKYVNRISDLLFAIAKNCATEPEVPVTYPFPNDPVSEETK